MTDKELFDLVDRVVTTAKRDSMQSAMDILKPYLKRRRPRRKKSGRANARGATSLD